MTIIERASGQLHGVGLLPSTPAGRAAGWYLGAAVRGARLPDADEIGTWVARVAAEQTPAAGWAGFFSFWQASDWAVAEILGARGSEDEITVTVRAVDGRIWDITVVVDATGRITEDHQSRNRSARPRQSISCSC
jgi:hypothetical protein